MDRALAQAELAFSKGEVPVGAVVASNSRVLFEAHNLTEDQHDPAAHAEILAIRGAARAIGDWRLREVILVVTLEPCSMCAGAIKLARVPTVAFGALDPQAGAMGSLYDISADKRTGTPPRVISCVQEARCRELLKRFFAERRGASRLDP